MAVTQPHLEHRKTGFYWRRRVPALQRNQHTRSFFCFPLKTHLPREAAELARRLTALSELCFNAERPVSPEVMTQILVCHARLEIETADRLRALTGPRSREAAEAALEIEARLRASLQDAIFLCDRGPAVAPIRDMAGRLGLHLDEEEEDFAILADRMVRLMIELSEEKERRARGIFRETQPYIDIAMQSGAQTPSSSAAHQKAASRPLPAARAPASPSEEIGAPSEMVLFSASGQKIALDPVKLPPVTTAGPAPSLVQLFDDWFRDLSNGTISSGAYVFEDAPTADKFRKNADTVSATRKLILDVFGDRPVTEIDAATWKGFNDTLRKLPNNHGKSPKDRQKTCYEVIEAAERKQARDIRKAKHKIRVNDITGDEAEALLRNARVARLSPRTFQRHQKHLSAPIDHAVRKGLLSHNPFKPFVLGEAVIDKLRSARPETSRQLWNDEFKAMLATEKWTSPRTRIDDPLYWVPLIARLSRLRSEEILQLKPSNIRSDDGIHYFHIECGTGQSVKSENGRRMVPLHSQLIELGLLELVARQRQSKKRRIFDRIERSKSGKLTFTATFTKRFSYYRMSRKVYDPRRDLHALRTTFHSKCVANAVPDTARRYLMGHKNTDVGITNYLPEGFDLARLKAYIEMDRIDLGAVTRRFGAEAQKSRGPRLVAKDGVALTA